MSFVCGNCKKEITFEHLEYLPGAKCPFCGNRILPVSETLKVLQSTTLYKTGKWWSAIALLDAFGKKQVAVYLWINRNDQWKRKQKFVVHNKAEWEKIKGTIDKFVQELPY